MKIGRERNMRSAFDWFNNYRKGDLRLELIKGRGVGKEERILDRAIELNGQAVFASENRYARKGNLRKCRGREKEKRNYGSQKERLKIPSANITYKTEIVIVRRETERL